jgi:hypothetical protein
VIEKMPGEGHDIFKSRQPGGYADGSAHEFMSAIMSFNASLSSAHSFMASIISDKVTTLHGRPFPGKAHEGMVVVIEGGSGRNKTIVVVVEIVVEVVVSAGNE